MKLFTTVQPDPLSLKLIPGEKIFLTGSCFADEFAPLLRAAGFTVCSNPFGTVYNPLSIEASISRLESGMPFTTQDCIETGSGRICSFFHHSSFARDSREEFLENANAELRSASTFWEKADTVIVTLGTAWVWKRNGQTVSNCLKRSGREFTQELMNASEVRDCILRIVDKCAGKKLIFTISPIRHRGARDNTLGKAALHLGVYEAGVCYFPAFEILMDELRDYRFYAKDLVHPSPTAIEIIWERFLDAVTTKQDRLTIEENLSVARRNAHIPR